MWKNSKAMNYVDIYILIPCILGSNWCALSSHFYPRLSESCQLSDETNFIPLNYPLKSGLAAVDDFLFSSTLFQIWLSAKVFHDICVKFVSCLPFSWRAYQSSIKKWKNWSITTLSCTIVTTTVKKVSPEEATEASVYNFFNE